MRPELPLGFGDAAFSTERVKTRQHATDIAIQNSGSSSESNRYDRARGGSTDTGQRGEGVHVVWDPTAMVFDDLDCRHMKVPRAPVVTQPGPVFEYFVLARLGESAYAGETS